MDENEKICQMISSASPNPHHSLAPQPQRDIPPSTSTIPTTNAKHVSRYHDTNTKPTTTHPLPTPHNPHPTRRARTPHRPPKRA